MHCVQLLCFVYPARLTKPGVFTSQEEMGLDHDGTKAARLRGPSNSPLLPLPDSALLLTFAPKTPAILEYTGWG